MAADKTLSHEANLHAEDDSVDFSFLQTLLLYRYDPLLLPSERVGLSPALLVPVILLVIIHYPPSLRFLLT